MWFHPILLALVLGTVGLIVKMWLLRQDIATRAYVSLGLLSIAMWLYAYALYDACHGRVDFLHAPFKCSSDGAVAFNPAAWRIGRAR